MLYNAYTIASNAAVLPWKLGSNLESAFLFVPILKETKGVLVNKKQIQVISTCTTFAIQQTKLHCLYAFIRLYSMPACSSAPGHARTPLNMPEHPSACLCTPEQVPSCQPLETADICHRFPEGVSLEQNNRMYPDIRTGQNSDQKDRQKTLHSAGESS